jgi:hypothetical protein
MTSMRRRGVSLFTILLLCIAGTTAQTLQLESAEVWCPSVLGVGLATETPYCDVQIQVEPELAIRVLLPPRRGEATLSFSLHNRHTYSRAEEEEGRAYAQYLASVAVATMDGEIIGQGAVLSEFRTAADLVDRVAAGTGGSRLRAVAPTGTERVVVTVPDDVDELVIAGQSLEIVRGDGRDMVTGLGLPVATVSDVAIEYEAR